MRQDGIQDLDGILQRCSIDTDSGCWVWRGGMNSSGVPLCNLPPGVLAPGRKVLSARRAAWLLSGRRLAAGQIVYRQHCCTEERCVNPYHSAAGAKGAQIASAAKRDPEHFRGVDRLRGLRRQAFTQAKSVELVGQIERMLSGGHTAAHCASHFGVHRSTADAIAKHQHIHQRPAVLRAASVFAWGGGV